MDKKLDIIQSCQYGQLAKLQMSGYTVQLHDAGINEPKESSEVLIT